MLTILLAALTIVPMENIAPGDLVHFEQENTTGVYMGDNKFVHVVEDKVQVGHLDDPEWNCQIKTALTEMEKPCSFAQDTPEAAESFDDQFSFYFLNEQKLPLVISPKDPNVSLPLFQEWIDGHRAQLLSLLSSHGGLLLRGFPVAKAEDFAAVVQTVLNKELLDYKGGEGSRRRVAKGVYTSTEAPPQFKIPLHNELSCTDNPPGHICFYCDIAPAPGSGQTILASTAKITRDIQALPDLWNLFHGKTIHYISRHPPEGSYFNKVNPTHKTWPNVFETKDKAEAEAICLKKGFAYRWLGDWIEVTRSAPATRGPYWFNQAHLYHANPRIRGGMLYHTLANMLYIVPSTNQYDVQFSDGTPITQEVIYQVYDVLDQNTVKFDWQKNDVLILDNIEALHGRAPYAGPRRILVSMVP